MQNSYHYEQQTVEQVKKHMPYASTVLRTHRIDVNGRMSLANAAAATSNTPDELLAAMEYQVRRLAK